MEKVLVIVGQTATGKSELAVRLAKRLNGEVISADSRQIYKGLDLGSGKITKKEMRGVPHHLLDVANPKSRFTAAQYKKLAEKKIEEIIKRGKLPIICGGTGFYIDAIVSGQIFPAVPPNIKLRSSLNKKSADELYVVLGKLDPLRAKNIDKYNKVRLIRAIEIASALGKVPTLLKENPKYQFVKIGLSVPEETLKRKIRLRLKKRVRSGMVVEIYELHKKGVPWKRFLELGFDQKFITLYLQKKIDQKEMLGNLFKGNWNYAKRQKTWFKRDKQIRWFDLKKYREVLEYVKQSLV